MASKDDIIADLRAIVDKQTKRIDKQTKRIDKQTKQIAALLKEVEELKLKLAKASKDSSNSSKSPSSDITEPKKEKGKRGRPKKRTVGGQPGHNRKLPEPLPQKRVDETSFKNNGKKNRVWCISSAILTVFHIAKTRSRVVLEELVGEEFKGYLNFDYFSANCSFAWNYDMAQSPEHDGNRFRAFDESASRSVP